MRANEPLCRVLRMGRSGRSAKMRIPRTSDSRLPCTSAIDVPRSGGGRIEAATIRRRFAANCGLFSYFLTQVASRFTQSSGPARATEASTAVPDAVGRRTRRSTGAVTLGGRPAQARRLTRGSGPVRPKSATTPGACAPSEPPTALVDRARDGRRATVNGRSLSRETPCRAGTDDRRAGPKTARREGG
jgi:hypothetical protein